ncbi:uncharacterized protein F4812DRAFT_236516 [Daldinia caldariorum]|uniref:uncharacterized protein n=1 Tax=Daldinia caldariorum TaxID=326644 RepID=UPI002008C7E7|nr:uncharacterized protein F4812DRAFT_236516 [Daldinia caldariorum]KAI1463659.1 hypothetical protein F4812DRAFT_236516 [Daldinia caldariorum]
MSSRIASTFYLPIWLLAGQVSCGSIAAWWNTQAPSFIMQDDDTGNIRYSLCNGNYTPIFPDDKTLVAPFKDHLPKNKTSLSAAGWVDGETATASIFYMDTSDEIVNALLKCDWNTGHWENTGEFVVSGGAPKVAPDSGISAVLLGSVEGYRVYYNDLEGTLHEIGYTRTTTWSYYGVVSHDAVSSQAIGSTFSSGNISVVRPRDAENMGASQLYGDDMWHLSTFPEPLTRTGNHSTNATKASDLTLGSSSPNFTLPAWDGKASALAVTINNKDVRSVFYIGTDKKLYQVSNDGGGGGGNSTWSVSPRPEDDEKSWPVADAAGAPIAVASDVGSRTMRLYYVSGGRVVEVNGDHGRWQAATVLPSTNTSQTVGAPGSVATSMPAPDEDGKLSDGEKAGISVGVTLGVIALAGTPFLLWLMRRRQRRIDEAAAAAMAAARGDQYNKPEDNGSGPAYGPDGAQIAAQTGVGADGYAYGYGAAAQQQQQQTYAGYPQAQPVQTGYSQQQSQQPQQPGGVVYPQQMGYTVTPDGYAQQPAVTTAVAYPQQAGFTQNGEWVYTTPTGDNGAYYQQQQQQQYYHQYQQHPQEMPGDAKPVELMS